MENPLANNKSFNFDNTFVKIITFFVLPISFILAGILFSIAFDTDYSIWLLILFLLPVFIHIIGWVFIQRESHNIQFSPEKKPSIAIDGVEGFCFFYNITMFISTLSYSLAWLGYVFSIKFPHGVLDFLSFVCLILVFIQFSIAVYISYIVMENSQKPASVRRQNLRIGLELFPFWRFAHFFAIFICIAFLFGFAFAFHDLECRNKSQNDSSSKDNVEIYSGVQESSALYVENLPPDANSYKAVFKKENPADKNNLVGDLALTCFYFESGKAKFIARDRNEDMKKVRLKETERITLARETKNHNEMSKLLSQIEQGSLSGTPRIALIGRADDKRSSGEMYPSNYDLSEARIQVVRNEVINALYGKNNQTWQDIDWATVSQSNEGAKKIEENSDDIKNSCMNLESDVDSERRVVEARLSIVSPNEETNKLRKLQQKQSFEEFEKIKYKKPNLMDYVYFSIYTISTTGYGDIKPATNYAKFLVSLENFFEIFFLVCFMNSLIALKRETQTSQTSG